MRVFCECLSIFVDASFSFCFENGMWDLIVLIHDQCLHFYLKGNFLSKVDHSTCLSYILCRVV